MDFDSYRESQERKAREERDLRILRKQLVDLETIYNYGVSEGDGEMAELASAEIRRLQHLHRHRTGSDFELDLRTPGG